MPGKTQTPVHVNADDIWATFDDLPGQQQHHVIARVAELLDGHSTESLIWAGLHGDEGRVRNEIAVEVERAIHEQERP